MHQYLRAVGFSKIKTNAEVKDLLMKVVTSSNSKGFVETDDDSVLIEYNALFTESTGITVRGELNNDDSLSIDFYYPVCIGKNVSTEEEVDIERHAAYESFGGMCEDNRIGVSMIFFLQNGMDFMKESIKEGYENKSRPLYFSALSTQGTIMLPIRKNEKQKARIKETVNTRNQLIEAAKHGDEGALENLTLDEIDTYASISKKILKEDVFSLVDTYFMPYGIECDKYSILGEIEEVKLEQNSITQEEVYVLVVNCNGLSITICINSMDLLGEPLEGRRFKGTIWLQGRLDYMSL